MECYTLRPSLQVFLCPKRTCKGHTEEIPFQKRSINFIEFPKIKKMLMIIFYYFRGEVERIWVTFFLQGVPAKRNERSCGLILQRRADQNLFH